MSCPSGQEKDGEEPGQSLFTKEEAMTERTPKQQKAYEWRQKNKEKLRAYHKAWRDKNPDKLKAYKK
jgi:hypothetical protein